MQHYTICGERDDVAPLLVHGGLPGLLDEEPTARFPFISNSWFSNSFPDHALATNQIPSDFYHVKI
jgi:hypothetical protein